jgi:hypothetical protein
MSGQLKSFHLYWSPEGKRIATVKAKDQRAAKRKAPKPYRKYLGEIYAEEVKG